MASHKVMSKSTYTWKLYIRGLRVISRHVSCGGGDFNRLRLWKRLCMGWDEESVITWKDHHDNLQSSLGIGGN